MKKLWNGVKVKVVEVAGEQGVGKTLFGMSIDPKNTVMIDLEDSSVAYDIDVKKRYSLYEAIANGDIEVDNELGIPKAIDCFLWFKGIVEEIKEGDYTVMFVDPLADIEAGLVEWIEKNPEKFNATEGMFKSASGLKWGAVNSFWKTFGGTISAKVETFVYTNHMGLIWSSSGSPTGKKKAKGKDALTKLCSLRLELEKSYDKNGKVNDVPSAKVVKARFAKSEFIDGRMVHTPYLPPYLQRATYYDICKYIETPPDYANLKDTEVYVEKGLSSDEKLLIQQDIASNNAVIAESNMESMEFGVKVAAIREQRIADTKNTELKVPSGKTSKKPRQNPKVSKKTEIAKKEDSQVTKELKDDLESGMSKSTLPERTKVAKAIVLLGPGTFGDSDTAKDKITQMMHRFDPNAKKLTELDMESLKKIEDAMNASIAKKK